MVFLPESLRMPRPGPTPGHLVSQDKAERELKLYAEVQALISSLDSPWSLNELSRKFLTLHRRQALS